MTTLHFGAHLLRISKDVDSFIRQYSNKKKVEDFHFMPWIFKRIKECEYEVFSLNAVPEDYKEAVRKIADASDPLITPEFLLSKGWVKIGAMINGYQLRDTDYELEFHLDDNWMVIYWVDTHDGTKYQGKIPTESQYEALNQLLELHE